MQTEIATRLTNTELIQLIEEATTTEMCRDVDSLRNILQRVRKDNDRLPTFSEYDSPIEAELLIPHILMVKALIFIEERKYGAALKTIEEALSDFYKGEDFDGLTAALWTKVLCLIRMQRAEDAFMIFLELERIALENGGEIAVRKFIKNLTEEIYLLRHLPLTPEISEFKKSRVKAALIEANGVVGKAAKILRVKNHQALSEILNKQFPGLLGELGFKRRARRTVKS